MQPQPFENEFSNQADEMSDLMAEGEEGQEEGFEGEGLEGDAFEGEGFAGDGFEAEGMEGEGFEGEGFAGEGLEGEGFEGEGFAGDGFEAEGMEGEGFEGEGFAGEDSALEDAFAEAMDAQSEDEFLRRLMGAHRRVASVAGPTFRRIWRRAMPVAVRLLRQAAPQLRGIAGQEIGRSMSGLLQADAMDAFAASAADHASEEDLEAFTRVLGGLAARHVVRATIPPARRRQQPQQVRALGRAVGQMTTRIANRIVQRYGARALPAVTRVVNQVSRLVRQQGASPQAVPRMIQRIGTRVLSSPRAVRRLAQPLPAARRLAQKAGVRRILSRPLGTTAGSGTWGGTRRIPTVRLRAPVRIVVR